MSAYLLNAAVAYVRSQFTTDQVKTVEPYGGQFSASEVGEVSYNCPAIFLTVLGWQKEANGQRLSGKYVRHVRMGAFVAFKHQQRTSRMVGAMNLADQLSLVLRLWQPDSTGLPCVIAPLEEDATCENLYGRAIDKAGQALWMVDWFQCVKPIVPLEQLYDLIAIEIIDTTYQGSVPDAPPPPTNPTPLTVTEEIDFVPLPPPTDD